MWQQDQNPYVSPAARIAENSNWWFRKRKTKVREDCSFVIVHSSFVSFPPMNNEQSSMNNSPNLTPRPKSSRQRATRRSPSNCIGRHNHSPPIELVRMKCWQSTLLVNDIRRPKEVIQKMINPL
jgi:hypothetical protein